MKQLCRFRHLLNQRMNVKSLKGFYEAALQRTSIPLVSAEKSCRLLSLELGQNRIYQQKSTLHTWWDELYVISGPQIGSILKESGTAGDIDALGGNMQIIMQSKTKLTKKNMGRQRGATQSCKHNQEHFVHDTVVFQWSVLQSSTNSTRTGSKTDKTFPTNFQAGKNNLF